MYSTKSVHKMAGASFLGGKYVDPHKREGKSSRTSGKQFVVAHPKQGNASNPGVLFSKLPGEKRADPYDTGNGFLKSHPPESRKLGFGSHDAPKKGEFLSSQRTAQYKETMMANEAMERDQVFRKGGIEHQISQLEERMKSLEAEHPGLSQERSEDDYVGKVPRRLYDIGRSEQGTTETMLKDGRDQFFSQRRCAKHEKPRHVQRLATTTGDYGLRQWNHRGGDKVITIGTVKSGVKGKFLDRCHLRVANHDD
mmetsp:Transcript_20588/g.65682  ORF Transcript_20588/g.65682 Transcript_20588/m.65682 type:complete len:253 (-) Transcript_20588:247-1005(-)